MDTRGVIDHITQWLADYAREAGMSGFALGISGGVDSAVTSALCARTSMDVLCLQLPIHQAISESSRAIRHIEHLKKNHTRVKSIIHDLSGVYDTFVASIPSGEAPQGLALANLQSRLRMSAIYYHAATHGLLVAGTGNKVEDFGVGFFTKYGDGAVDLSPIADLMKSEVYAIGAELNIDEEILQAAPTDGLWGDRRTDEDQLGASYPELEWAMTYRGDDENLTDRQREVLAIYRRLHAANKHKFTPIPVCTIPPRLRESKN